MSDGRGSNINAFLLGMVVGGVLGVLFAPDKGKETRKKLKENYKEWSKKALELAESLGEEVEPYVERATEAVAPVISGVKQEVAGEPKPLVEEVDREEPTPPRIERMRETATSPSDDNELPAAKEELDRAVDRARDELKKRDQKTRPRFFKGI